MDKDNPIQPLDPQVNEILQVSWRRYAQLDQKATTLERKSNQGGIWVAVLGLLFVLLAVIFDIYSVSIPDTSALVVRGLFIVTPIVVAILAAYSGRSRGITERQLMRGGAEEILRSIYLFRTVLKNQPQRRDWMGGRLVAIQRQLSQALGRELSLVPYDGEIPPQQFFVEDNSDTGFFDLSTEDYVKYRLENQLAWYIHKADRYQGRRTRWIFSILLAGGAGALMIAFGGPLVTWAALIASAAFIQSGWRELTRLDTQNQKDNRVITELIDIYEKWKQHTEEPGKLESLADVVQATEMILWFRQTAYLQAVSKSMLYLESELFVQQSIAQESTGLILTAPEVGVAYQDLFAESVEGEAPLSDAQEEAQAVFAGMGVRTFETYNGAIASLKFREKQEVSSGEEELDLEDTEEEAELEEQREASTEADVLLEDHLEEDIVSVTDEHEHENEEVLTEIPDIEDDQIEMDYTAYVLRELEDITEKYADVSFNRGTEMHLINQVLARFK